MESYLTITETHLQLSYSMLTGIIEICPDNLWFTQDESSSIWKRILHVLESIDYWLDDFNSYSFANLFTDMSAEMDVTNNRVLSKEEIRRYSDSIATKINHFFECLTQDMLLKKSVKHTNVTYLDIILSQIRHIQINIGYCNEKLNNSGAKGIQWIGYNEGC